MCKGKGTVRRWAKKFAETSPAETDLHNQAQCGRPNSASDVQLQERVDEIIQANRRTKVRDISEMLGISVGSAQCIIHYVLGYRKVCSRPELGPTDFPKLKKYLKGKCYADDDEVQADVRCWFRGKLHEFFAKGMRQLFRICIDKEGDYVEK
ncbi:uncharacterized protein LOC101857959 [Aplysia californica]|uniref:Uncharacterized protein LOC101857959 n=1 Tax=Aplysia californica TaxID=6500 RepID=A0ABM0JVH3_APLCA|nr:uncharacterized protein LOC101857959 [Aplysia californica]